MHVHAHGPGQEVAVLGHPDAVVAGKLFQLAVAEQVQARVTDVEHVPVVDLITSPVKVVTMPWPWRSVSRLGRTTSVDRSQHLGGRGLGRPGVGGAQVVVDEAADADLGRLAPALGTAHAIGDRRHHALVAQRAALRAQHARRIRVLGLVAGLGATGVVDEQ